MLLESNGTGADFMHANTNDCSIDREMYSSPRNYTDSYTMSLRAKSTGPTATAPPVLPQGLTGIYENYVQQLDSPSRFKLGCYKQSQAVEAPKRQQYDTIN